MMNIILAQDARSHDEDFNMDFIIDVDDLLDPDRVGEPYIRLKALADKTFSLLAPYRPDHHLPT